MFISENGKFSTKFSTFPQLRWWMDKSGEKWIDVVGAMEWYLKTNKGYDGGLFSYTDIETKKWRYKTIKRRASKDALKFTVFDYVETGSVVISYQLLCKTY